MDLLQPTRALLWTRLPVAECDPHRLQSFGSETLRRTPRSHQYHPAGPVNGIPSARHRGDSVDPEIPLIEFIAFNTPRRRRRDSNRANALRTPPMRSPDACSRARVWWRAGSASHRNSASRHTLDICADGPNEPPLSRTHRIDGALHV